MSARCLIAAGLLLKASHRKRTAWEALGRALLSNLQLYNIVNLQILLHFVFICDFTTPNLLHLLGFRNDLAIHPSLGHDALDLLLRVFKGGNPE